MLTHVQISKWSLKKKSFKQLRSIYVNHTVTNASHACVHRETCLCRKNSGNGLKWLLMGNGSRAGRSGSVFSPLYPFIWFDLFVMNNYWFYKQERGKIWTICGISSFPVPSTWTSHIVWPRSSRAAGRRALNWTSRAAKSKRLPSTHHLPGVAHVVGLLSSLPQLVYVPRQRRVHRDSDNPAA